MGCSTLGRRMWKRSYEIISKWVGNSAPVVADIAAKEKSPYSVLVSTVISLRTKDAVTYMASNRLLSRAPSVAVLSTLSTTEIAELIYPAGFYRTKSQQLSQISTILMRKFAGDVPDSLSLLLTLPGVGRKTANLVLGLGFGIPAICVDIHVHRICNRLGWVSTKSPDDTELSLASFLPREFWIPINALLVRYGQEVCTPVSPHCSRCKVQNICDRCGVTNYR